jgi:ubiquinone/menaquinone biosynthesis C-methylase UbiE
MSAQISMCITFLGACLAPLMLAAATPRQHQHQHDTAATPVAPASGEVDVHRPGMKHDFSDVAKMEKGFDNPERVAWQKPDEVIALMALRPGLTVADIGAGTGFFEPYLAGAVGHDGKVLALDVEPNMVEHLKTRAAAAGLTQVEAKLVAPDDPGLAPGTIDRVIIVNTWHHIDDRGNYSKKLLAALKPEGSVWVVDFDKTSGKGPPPEHKLEPREVIAELTAGGLKAERVDESLPDQYIVVGRR